MGKIKQRASSEWKNALSISVFPEIVGYIVSNMRICLIGFRADYYAVFINVLT